MSMTLVVTWAGTAVPTREAWQQALDAAGMPAQLGEVGDLAQHTGFWPVTWQGRPSGFEWQWGPADATLGGPAGGSTALLVAQGDNAPSALAAAATTNRRRRRDRSRIGSLARWQRSTKAPQSATPASSAPSVPRSAQPQTSLCEMPSTTRATPLKPSTAPR